MNTRYKMYLNYMNIPSGRVTYLGVTEATALPTDH